MKDKEKAAGIGIKFRDNLANIGVKREVAEQFSVVAQEAAHEMAEWKDSQIRGILMKYTLWLDKRGFFAEDLQCDFGHQIDTFLEMNDIKVEGE